MKIILAGDLYLGLPDKFLVERLIIMSELTIAINIECNTLAYPVNFNIPRVSDLVEVTTFKEILPGIEVVSLDRFNDIVKLADEKGIDRIVVVYNDVIPDMHSQKTWMLRTFEYPAYHASFEAWLDRLKNAHKAKAEIIS